MVPNSYPKAFTEDALFKNNGVYNEFRKIENWENYVIDRLIYQYDLYAKSIVRPTLDQCDLDFV